MQLISGIKSTQNSYQKTLITENLKSPVSYLTGLSFNYHLKKKLCKNKL